MQSQPWIYECPKSSLKGALHHWVRKNDGTARCKYCDLGLTKSEADECFTQR